MDKVSTIHTDFSLLKNLCPLNFLFLTVISKWHMGGSKWKNFYLAKYL